MYCFTSASDLKQDLPFWEIPINYILIILWLFLHFIHLLAYYLVDPINWDRSAHCGDKLFKLGAQDAESGVRTYLSGFPLLPLTYNNPLQ